MGVCSADMATLCGLDFAKPFFNNKVISMKLNKKTLFAVAATTLLSGAAMAETGYSFYGRANLSVERQTTGGDTVTKMQDNSSRLGFRATRDLPSNMTAGVVLEAGTNLTSGSTSSTFFAREATASLAGGFGQVKLGRLAASTAYFATADFISNHNHDTGTSSDELYEFLATGQLNNAISYAAPKMGGLTLEAQYGLKNGSGTGTSVTNVNVAPVAMSANYDAGPLQLGLGYERAETKNVMGANITGSQVAARAFYSMGPLGLGGYVQKSSGTQFDRTAYRLTAMYTLGQSEFHVNYGSAGDRAGVANTGAQQTTLGYNYNLDKATKVYGFVTKLDKDAGTAGDFKSVALGLRYNF